MPFLFLIMGPLPNLIYEEWLGSFHFPIIWVLAKGLHFIPQGLSLGKVENMPHPHPHGPSPSATCKVETSLWVLQHCFLSQQLEDRGHCPLSCKQKGLSGSPQAPGTHTLTPAGRAAPCWECTAGWCLLWARKQLSTVYDYAVIQKPDLSVASFQRDHLHVPWLPLYGVFYPETGPLGLKRETPRVCEHT